MRHLAVSVSLVLLAMSVPATSWAAKPVRPKSQVSAEVSGRPQFLVRKSARLIQRRSTPQEVRPKAAKQDRRSVAKASRAVKRANRRARAGRIARTTGIVVAGTTAVTLPTWLGVIYGASNGDVASGATVGFAGSFLVAMGVSGLVPSKK